MSKNDAAKTGGDGEGNTYTAPATQADFDRIITERVSRERNKFGDYDDLKAKADKYDTAEREQLSELERATGQVTDLQAKVTAFESEKESAKLRAEVAEATKVPASALRGSTREELEAHAKTLGDLLGSDEDKKKLGKTGPYIGSEGQPTGGKVGDSAASNFADFRTNRNK